MGTKIDLLPLVVRNNMTREHTEVAMGVVIVTRVP